MKIAFFGLGNMGLPIACNLLASGYEVTTAAHRQRRGPEALAQAGGVVAASAAEAVRDADLIFTILPDDQALSSFLLDEALADAMKPGAVIVDMTSCSAAAIRQVEAFYAPRQISVVDAPLSGGVDGAVNRRLTIICAGEPADLAKVRPVFETIAEKIYAVGPLGQAKVIKSLNNLLGAANMLVMAEVAKIVQHNQLDQQVFFEVISNSSGNSVLFQRNYLRMVAGDFVPDFSLALMRKDVALAADLAEAIPQPLPVVSLVADTYAQAGAFDQEDCRAIIKVLD